MRWFVSVVALGLAVSIPAVLAQSTKPGVPSGQNSGAGIPGKAGGKSGPAVEPGTARSSPADKQENPTVRQQDPSNIQGMKGNKSGPPAKHQ